MPDDQKAVRPLGPATPGRNSPPPLILVAILLVVGGLLGWGIATLTGGGIATATPTTLLGEDSSPLGDATLEAEDRPTVTWTPAITVPQVPDGMEYAGATDPVEYEGSIYLVVRFSESDTGDTSNHLWTSADGNEWSSSPIELGQSVPVVELTTIADGLMVTGQDEEFFGLWRSVPGRSFGGSSWIPIPLEIPTDFEPVFHATAVNRSGGITSTVIGNLAIWREVIAPYVPEGIDLAHPDLTLSQGVLYPGDGSAFELFAEPPEVLTSRNTVWIRLVTTDGDEILQTRELQPGAYPVEDAPDLAFIPVALSWISNDGAEFLNVTGRNALPPGYFLPEPWEDGFISAKYELADAFATNEDVTLWRSGSGRAWERSDDQPPRECSPFFFARSNDTLLLTAEDRTRCAWNRAEGWTVLPDPCTSCYAIGGPAGFLAYPSSFDYDTALYSSDGHTWVDVAIPAPEPYPTLSILEERLLAFSVHQPRPTAPKRIEIWLGQIG